MRVQVYYVGKTRERYLREGEAVYEKRLGHYLPIGFNIIADVRGGGKLPSDRLREKEGEAILKALTPTDGLILLDEAGKSMTSKKFATWLDRQLQQPYRRLVFVVGGAYGFSPAVYERADGRLSLSDMTFSHQMIRLFFSEQLYRAMTILRGEKYHNE